MEGLNLKRVWEILNIVSKKEEELEENDIYHRLLGVTYQDSFNHFITYFSFRFIDDSNGNIDTLLVYNNDPIPYEDFNVDTNINIPIKILSMSDDELHVWMYDKIKELDDKAVIEKENEKTYLKSQIKMLQGRLDKL